MRRKVLPLKQRTYKLVINLTNHKDLLSEKLLPVEVEAILQTHGDVLQTQAARSCMVLLNPEELTLKTVLLLLLGKN